jgi:HSP20 family protein
MLTRIRSSRFVHPFVLTAVPCQISGPVQQVPAGKPSGIAEYFRRTLRIPAIPDAGGYRMVRWYYPSVFDELDDMRKYMESLSRQMYVPSPMALLPGPEAPETRLLPAQRGGFHVDVTESDSDVVVTADLIPGVSRQDITLTLTNPQALEISCERRMENEEEKEGFFLRERTFGSMARVVPLPKPVSEEGSRASFKNGVLEVHLKKFAREPKGTISID